MSASKEFEEACLKHLQGKHNQKRHGWRYGQNYEPGRFDDDSREYHARQTAKRIDAESYEKMRQMVESDNPLDLNTADDFDQYSKNLASRATELRNIGKDREKKELPEGYTAAQTEMSRSLFSQSRAAKKIAQEIRAGNIKPAKTKPYKPPKKTTPKVRKTGDSSKVDYSLAANAYRLARGDRKAAYSQVVRLTGLKPGFDNKDLQAWFDENGYS
jgi:hypothetical protein